jgi:hypothetical protein
MDATATASATNAQLRQRATTLGTELTVRLAELLHVVGELDRRQAFRDEGATSVVTWLAQHLGVAESTGRQWAQLAQRLYDYPLLAKGMESGDISFDKARAAADLAAVADHDHDHDSTSVHTITPDAAVVEQARHCTVRQLADLARATKGTSNAKGAEHYERRYLRCHDDRRTITAQLPEEHYVLVRNMLAKEAQRVASDGETPLDQRMADALVRFCRRGGGSGSAGPDVHVVVHADLALLRGGTGRAELERLGLLSSEAARRLACDASVALAIDDAFGHTMAEGRAERLPTDQQRREVWRRDRTCRFPGCSNSLFTNVHHLVHWAEGGTTDLENLVLLCSHHHHTVHEKRWQVSGNPNGTLHFMGPTKKMLTSRPSPLWTRRN